MFSSINLQLEKKCVLCTNQNRKQKKISNSANSNTVRDYMLHGVVSKRMGNCEFVTAQVSINSSAEYDAPAQTPTIILLLFDAFHALHRRNIDTHTLKPHTAPTCRYTQTRRVHFARRKHDATNIAMELTVGVLCIFCI